MRPAPEFETWWPGCRPAKAGSRYKSAGAAGGAEALTPSYDGGRGKLVGIGAPLRSVPTPSAPFLSNGVNELLGRRDHDTEPGLGRSPCEVQGRRGRSPCRRRGYPSLCTPLRIALRPYLQSGATHDDQRG